MEKMVPREPMQRRSCIVILVEELCSEYSMVWGVTHSWSESVE